MQAHGALEQPPHNVATKAWCGCAPLPDSQAGRQFMCRHMIRVQAFYRDQAFCFSPDPNSGPCVVALIPKDPLKQRT